MAPSPSTDTRCGPRHKPRQTPGSEGGYEPREGLALSIYTPIATGPLALATTRQAYALMCEGHSL